MAFEINSKGKIDQKELNQEIMLSSAYLLGEIGMAKASIMIFKDKFRENKGLIMVNRNYLNYLRAALALIKSVAGVPAIVRSIGASGTVKKAEKYLA
ncbi:hypothetical protein KY308_02830 [Candidatus Woesearchaeota archaeon]|nr:hypothetical protein [Candidatus Woesearchaeota archaeon]